MNMFKKSDFFDDCRYLLTISPHAA